MPFGLTNAPATIQGLMECTLAGLTEQQCLIYLDDVVVFSKGASRDAIKCLASIASGRTDKQEMKYLDHIISAAGVKLDISKTEAVMKYPVPKNSKKLLRLTNYYQRFVSGYAHIATPLHKLPTKGDNFHWDTNAQLAFDSLKNSCSSMCSERVIVHVKYIIFIRLFAVCCCLRVNAGLLIKTSREFLKLLHRPCCPSAGFFHEISTHIVDDAMIIMEITWHRF